MDADADVFDYRIYWKQWDDSEPQLTVRWCLAAFIMFDSDASNDEQFRSEKIVADMKEIFKTKEMLETLEAKNQGRSKGDQRSKESSLSTIFECQQSSRNPHGRPISVELLKFCRTGELDYIYDIDTAQYDLPDH